MGCYSRRAKTPSAAGGTPALPEADCTVRLASRVLRTFLLLLLTAPLFAADPPPAPEPADDAPQSDRQEWWVPADKVGAVLKDYPRAVLLSRAQYEELLKDAGPRDPKPPKPPLEAALVSANYIGRVEGKVLTVEGELVAEVLSGEWARVPLRLGTLALSEVKVDGEGALALPPEPKPQANAQPAQQPKAQPQGKAAAPAEPPAEEPKTSTLLLRGRGPHKIAVRFAAPIAVLDAWHTADLTLPIAGATSLVVNFPANTLAECKQPLRIEPIADGTRITVALPLDSGDVTLRWRSSGGGLVALPPSLHSNTGFQVDAETVQARTDLTVSTATGTLPETLDFTLPADGRMVEITGSDVAGWAVEGQTVHVKLPPGRGARAEFTTIVQRPTGLTPAGAEVLMPLPQLAGAGRVDGEFTVVGGPGVAMREWTPTPGATPLAPVPGTAGHWRFVGPQVAPKIRVERLRPRFFADLDTLVDFQPDAIYLERTVTLHPEEGGVFNLLLTLPTGEEALEVHAVAPPVLTLANASAAQAQQPAEADPLWRVEAGKLSLRWLTDPVHGHPRTFRVKTRTEPAGWAAGVGRTAAAPAPGVAPAAAETLLFPVAEMTIEGAEKVSGYLALRASENFRLETEAADMLEPRDGRTTPVTGAYAWFRRGAFDLKVRVTRRPSELLATITGYALPLAGVLDLHAQIVWDFRYSGVRSVQVRVPEKQAGEFHFEGPQIAERTLAGDIWTIVFQKELTGRQVLAVTAKIPVTRAADDASRFTATVPVIEPLHTQRGSGTWVVEANTDTEIQLTATGMNELDALLAPPLEDYQPRHRVIGVFTWLGPKYELNLSGVRHPGAGVLTTVVDSMDLTSVLATTGLVRSEAVLQLRTAGAQFLDVTLPDGARLLSLLVDGEPSKPVEGAPGHVRVQLTAKQDTTAPAELRVLFENNATPEWKARGQSTLAPLRLPPEVPVLNTTWRAFLPEGYYYDDAKNNFTTAPRGIERPLLFAPWALWDVRKALRALTVLAGSGISDPRPLDSWLPERDKPLVERLARVTGRAGGGALELLGGSVQSMGDGRNTGAFPGTGDLTISSGGLMTEEKDAREDSAKIQGNIFGGAIVGKANESPDNYNRSIGPEFRKRVEEVKQLLSEAHGFYDSGRYDLATRRCEQILKLDPYNIAARKFQEQINKKKEDYGIEGSNQSRSFALQQTTKAWDRPLRRFTADSGSIESHGLAGRIRRKLDTIIIPKLEFREAGVREAVEYLKRKSVEFDTAEPDPTKRGVNIVLRIDSQPTAASPANSIPGLVDPNQPNPPPPVPSVDPNEARITIALNNIPLGEALRYVTNLAGLKFKIEGDAVAVVPLSTPSNEPLVTKEYKVPPGFLSAPPEINVPGNAQLPPGGSTDATKGGTGIAKHLEARDYLEAAGITFPPGSSAVFLPSSGKLIVKNTQENLDEADVILENGAPPPLAPPINLPVAGEQAKKVGLLPMRLELPRVGDELVVKGFGAPEQMQVEYYAEADRSRRNRWIFLLGAVGYFCVGGRHPWWRTAWVALLLTAVPLVVSPDSMGLCNLLLGGWLVGLVVGRLARRFIFNARTNKGVPA